MNEKKLKKGIYYVGDPCYIFEKSWMKVLTDTNYLRDTNSKIFGKDFFAHGTCYGDGFYLDDSNKGRHYAVDSGMIGVIPIQLILKDKVFTKEEINKKDNMHIIIFEKDFECSYKNGTFYIDDIEIETGKKIMKLQNEKYYFTYDVLYIKKDIKHIPIHKKAIYWIYDKEENLIYLGISFDVKKRITKHLYNFKEFGFFSLIFQEDLSIDISKLERIFLATVSTKYNTEDRFNTRHYSKEYHKMECNISQKINMERIKEKMKREVFKNV